MIDAKFLWLRVEDFQNGGGGASQSLAGRALLGVGPNNVLDHYIPPQVLKKVVASIWQFLVYTETSCHAEIR
jgi:hypothetical protein